MIDAQQLPPLPPHWTRAYDERGQVYYIDTLSKRHQWTHPLMSTLGSQRALHTLRPHAPQPTPYPPLAAPAAAAASAYPPLAAAAYAQPPLRGPQQQQQGLHAQLLQPPQSSARAAPLLGAVGSKGSGYFAHFRAEGTRPRLV